MKSITIALLVAAAPVSAQDTLHLPALQEAAVMNDARTREIALRETATELRLRNLAVERLPALRLRGEATRQSEVATLPIDVPGADAPMPPKDRYEVALNVDWLLLDGGTIDARRGVELAALAAEHAELNAQLYPLRMEVVEAFYGARLLQDRLLAQEALIDDLAARLAEVRDRVAAGAALPGDTAAIRAEMLRAMQRRSELDSDRRAALAVLANLTGRDIAPDAVLDLPALDDDVARVRASDVEVPPVHPQYAAFAAQRERLERDAAAVRSRTRPQVSAFGTYAYGRPGLSLFTDDPHDWWLAGIRLQWAPWNWGTTARDVEVLRIRGLILDAQEEAFTDRLRRQVQQPIETMDRLRATIELDEQIIVLREQVERQARAQLEERAITAADYIEARTDLQEARVALLLHRAELSRAQAGYLTTLGIVLR